MRETILEHVNNEDNSSNTQMFKGSSMKKMPTEYKDSVVGGGTVVNFMFDGNTDVDLSKLS